VDRRKPGTKHHLLVDGGGRAPVSFAVTAANRHDVTQLLPLVDAIPAVKGKPGRPRRRFDKTQGDRAYDSKRHRRGLRKRRTEPVLARRGAPHGSGLGKYRWVVERAEAWVHQFRRLKLRYERRPEVHEAFVALACALICHSCLVDRFC
jgi:transposase